MSRLQKSLKHNKPKAGFEAVNADHARRIQFLPEDAALSDVIFSCYFVNQKDPQSNIIRRNANIEYIAPWYRSIEKIGVTGIIIHDGIEQSFIDRYQTDKILFRKFTPGNYSIFEERWMAYYLFLAQSDIQKAFFTDINDVYITRYPFDLIPDDCTLFVGRDDANKVRNSGWLLDELHEFEKESGIKAPSLYHHQYVYNAGVIGGGRAVMLSLMARVIDYAMQAHSAHHKDMTLLNLSIHDYLYPPIDTDLYSATRSNPVDDKKATHAHLVTGYPLNSRFKGYELNSDAYFIHK